MHDGALIVHLKQLNEFKNDKNQHKMFRIVPVLTSRTMMTGVSTQSPPKSQQILVRFSQRQNKATIATVCNLFRVYQLNPNGLLLFLLLFDVVTSNQISCVSYPIYITFVVRYPNGACFVFLIRTRSNFQTCRHTLSIFY